MTFPILQASAAIQTRLEMCSYTYYPLGSQTLKGYLIGNHYPYLMMKKNGSISSRKLLTMFKKLKTKNVVVMSLICVCSAQRQESQISYF